MKNKYLKTMAVGLAIAISSQTALACTTAPKPNIDTTDCKKVEPAKPAAKPETKPAEKPETKPATKPAAKPTEKPETKPNFVIDNFKVISMALEKLGVPQDELQQMIKDGKKLPEVLEAKNIKVNKFKKTLIKCYNKAINEGVANGQITKDEGKMLKQAIKQKVMKWLECQS